MERGIDWRGQKIASLVGRQSDSVAFELSAVLAYDLLFHATDVKADSGVWSGGMRPPAGRQTPSETEDGG